VVVLLGPITRREVIFPLARHEHTITRDADDHKGFNLCLTGDQIDRRGW
jgi:hypothetical protein